MNIPTSKTTELSQFRKVAETSSIRSRLRDIHNNEKVAQPGQRKSNSLKSNTAASTERVPLIGFFALFYSTILVGCTNDASTEVPGHGLFFILTFCISAFFFFLVFFDKGLTFGKFCCWIIINIVIWKCMSWTVEGGRWLLRQANDAMKSSVESPKLDLMAPHKDEIEKVIEVKRINNQELEKSNGIHSNKAPAASVLGSQRTQTSSSSPSSDIKVHNIKTEVKNLNTTDSPPFKEYGGVTMRLLQEMRDSQPSQSEELDFLEKRMEDVELSLLAGLKKATTGKQPVEDLKQMTEDLKMITSILKLPEECQYKKSILFLRKQMDVKSQEFEEKIKTGQTGKSIYMEMFTEIKQMNSRLDTLENRFLKLKSNAEALAEESGEWIVVYEDMSRLKGEAAAREELVTQLLEKEKFLAEKQESIKLNDAPPASKTKNKK